MIASKLCFLLVSLFHTSTGFTTTTRCFPQRASFHSLVSVASETTTLEKNPSKKPSVEWEIDCYSRPVMIGGKKLWEVLITDANGSFRLCETLPSNK